MTEQRRGDESASCAGAVLCGKVGALLSGSLTSAPGRDVCGRQGSQDARGWEPCSPGEGTRHRASPHHDSGRKGNANPCHCVQPPLICSPAPDLSSTACRPQCPPNPRSPCPIVGSHGRLRAWPRCLRQVRQLTPKACPYAPASLPCLLSAPTGCHAAPRPARGSPHTTSPWARLDSFTPFPAALHLWSPPDPSQRLGAPSGPGNSSPDSTVPNHRPRPPSAAPLPLHCGSPHPDPLLLPAD